MRYLDEYREPELVRQYAEKIEQTITRPWVLMEICGGQTHSIIRNGLDRLLPREIELIHGPGCPVCVTPISRIDLAIEIAKRPGCVLCSFGDMLRVPGSRQSLLQARAEGADVRTVYSPVDAVDLAADDPGRTYVFFAVGFETTAPANALAVQLAESRRLTNFRVLVAHVLVPPAIEAILSAPDNRVQGFLAAGHVCSIMGTAEYVQLASRYRVPFVVTGFEPVDIMLGVLCCVRQLEHGLSVVENPYARAVRPQGNVAARAAMERVFEVSDQVWRGIGQIPKSGLRLRPEYRHFDAAELAPDAFDGSEPDSLCRASDVLRGRMKPTSCPAFGTQCTPESPLGAPMVSSEGACAAYYRYRQGGCQE